MRRVEWYEAEVPVPNGDRIILKASTPEYLEQMLLRLAASVQHARADVTDFIDKELKKA